MQAVSFKGDIINGVDLNFLQLNFFLNKRTYLNKQCSEDQISIKTTLEQSSGKVVKLLWLGIKKKSQTLNVPQNNIKSFN